MLRAKQRERSGLRAQQDRPQLSPALCTKPWPWDTSAAPCPALCQPICLQSFMKGDVSFRLYCFVGRGVRAEAKAGCALQHSVLSPSQGRALPPDAQGLLPSSCSQPAPSPGTLPSPSAPPQIPSLFLNSPRALSPPSLPHLFSPLPLLTTTHEPVPSPTLLCRCPSAPPRCCQEQRILHLTPDPSSH